jgi:hypothetical protein
MFRKMPCSCQKPQPEYPVTDNWGPVLWAILHALAERSTRVSSPMFREDEKRLWPKIINELPKIIPCPSCREHAEVWILLHPTTAIKSLSDNDLHVWLVNWFYMFHESVNARTGKPPFDPALLYHTYGNISILGALNALKPFIEVAIRLSGLTLLPWQKWVKDVKTLNSFY